VIKVQLEKQERNHGARKLIAAISFYDLGQRKPSSEELVDMAKRFNYEAGAAFLARLNVCLSLAMASGDERSPPTYTKSWLQVFCHRHDYGKSQPLSGTNCTEPPSF